MYQSITETVKAISEAIITSKTPKEAYKKVLRIFKNTNELTGYEAYAQLTGEEFQHLPNNLAFALTFAPNCLFQHKELLTDPAYEKFTLKDLKEEF